MPDVLAKLLYTSSSFEWIVPASAIPLLPGLLLALAVSGGNIHNYDPKIVKAANWIFYTVAIYAVLIRFGARNKSHRDN